MATDENIRIVLVFPCTSSHVICLECFGIYCRSRLDERGFVQHPQLGSTLPCPERTALPVQEPSCWPDVLERGRLGGRCEQEGCGGRLADFFFKCASSNRLEGHDQRGSTVLSLVRCNFLGVPCLSCTDVRWYQRYQRFAAEEFVLQAGGVLCPQPGCGQGILVDQGCTRVTCEAATQGCGE
ncbi:hypothetical protein IscW_ISCW013634 [Ixodes scapularis]|uniref:RING-type domain-containing protein n=1 Tax=Ixodes scapularis TaxID=6945 RepID=B7QHF4_IXOSC|nr:hypothetical protein IscW_ISCW013634 [Ixodes scapularis]|eukprot:XP_002414611.1 hypothetical protein IscW_ISCW013634 [Ixodes scapularis]